jgi:hypothetical protein
VQRPFLLATRLALPLPRPVEREFVSAYGKGEGPRQAKDPLDGVGLLVEVAALGDDLTIVAFRSPVVALGPALLLANAHRLLFEPERELRQGFQWRLPSALLAGGSAPDGLLLHGRRRLAPFIFIASPRVAAAERVSDALHVPALDVEFLAGRVEVRARRRLSLGQTTLLRGERLQSRPNKQ